MQAGELCLSVHPSNRLCRALRSPCCPRSMSPRAVVVPPDGARSVMLAPSMVCLWQLRSALPASPVPLPTGGEGRCRQLPAGSSRVRSPCPPGSVVWVAVQGWVPIQGPATAAPLTSGLWRSWPWRCRRDDPSLGAGNALRAWQLPVQQMLLGQAPAPAMTPAMRTDGQTFTYCPTTPQNSRELLSCR